MSLAAGLTIFDKILLFLFVLAGLIVAYLLIRRSHWRLVRDSAAGLGFRMAHFPPRSARIADLEDEAENLEPRIASIEEQIAALKAQVDALLQQQQQNDEEYWPAP